MFVSPHKLTVDEEGNLWMADNGRPPGLQAHSGRQGADDARQEGRRRRGPDEFDAPTEVVIAPNGDIFIADGHTGGGTSRWQRAHHEVRQGRQVHQDVGQEGHGPGEFDVPHTLAFDSRDGCSSATARTTASRFSIRTASSSRSGSSSADRAASTSTHGPTRSMSPTRNRGTLEPTPANWASRRPVMASTRAPNAVSGSGALAMVP